MLFKRYLFLAACVLLFIFGFIAYFTICRAEMDGQFREEREKFNVQGVTLTSTSTPVETPAPAQPTTPASAAAPAPTADASAPATSSATTPTAPSSTDSPAPAMNPAADPNVIIGPVPPPPAAPTPATDGSTNAAPAPTDSTTAPMAPSSTMNEPRQSLAPFLVRAAYHPLAQVTNLTRPGTPTPAEPVPTITGADHALENPATNAVPSKAPATNSEATVAPVTNSVTTNLPPETAASHVAGLDASVIVLLYHQFTPSNIHAPPKMQWTMNVDVFAAEMKYIHDNGYHVIPMSDLIKFLHHEIGLPPKSVVITIDDGYKSAVVYAAPILKQYGYPWTFFIYPDFVTVAEGKGAVSWNDLLALQADGVDIESHSMTHPQLPKHTQKWKGSVHLLSPEEYDEWLTNETLGSKTVLEQKMGKPIFDLAYPYGAYNKEVEAKAIAAGYQYIFTVADNPVRATTDPHSIGRYTITQGVEKNFAAYLRQGALGLSDADPAPGGTTTNPRPVITAVLAYSGTLDPNSIETEVRDFGIVKHDFDPKTSTIRLYLPRDLIQPVNLVNIRVKDAQTGQIMVANWHFNYEAAGAAAGTHAPIAPATNAAPISLNPSVTTSSETPMSAATNVSPIAPVPASTPEPPIAKSAGIVPATSSKTH